MGTTHRRTCLALLGLGALVGGVTTSARAQQGSIAGQVTDQATGHPLAGARVTIHGTSLVTSSNAEGRYTLRNVPAGAVTVRATFIGYAAATRALTVGPGETATADLALKLTPYTLDAVVSTVSGDQTRKETPNAISTIGADKLVETRPITNMNDLLVAKAPGVEVLPGNITGAGARVRIRGTSSLSLNNEPIFVIDGVRMESANNSSSIGIGGTNPSRVNDIVRLDLVGVDVVDPALVRAADADARGVVGALHPDTVDHIDRLVVERQAARAPDAHPRTGAGDVSREHLDARHPRAQQVVHVGNRARLHEAVGPDGRDGVRSLLSCLVARDRGHHGVECIRRELEREVGGRSFARGDSQAASRRGIADERRPHGYGAGGNVAERVAPLGVARRHERRSLDGDAGPRERMPGRLVGYLAGDAALLGAGGCSDAPDQGAEPQQRETRSTMRGAHTSSPFRAGQRLRKPLARMQPRRRGRVIVQLTLQRRKGPYLEKSTFGACAAPGVCSSKYGRGPLPMTFAVSTWGKRRMYAL